MGWRKACEARPRSPTTQPGTSGRQPSRPGTIGNSCACPGARAKLTRAPACLGHDAGLGPEAAARATERFAVIPLCLRRAVSGRTRRLLVRPNVAAVQERHAERNLARLRRREQALPDPEMAPAVEGLRCHPPRPELRRNAAPLRPVVVPPDDRLDRATQVVMRRLAAGTARLDERLSAAHCASVKTASLSLSAIHQIW